MAGTSDDKLGEWMEDDGPDAKELARAARAEIRAKQDRARERKVARELAEQIEHAEERLDFALSISKHRQPPKPITTKRKSGGESAAVFVASDWHVGEVVRPETVNGRNEFTPEIAKQRATKYAQNCLRLLDIYRKGTRVDHVVFAILGDMITGYIHEELRESNSMSPVQETRFVRKLLATCIQTFLEHGEVKRLLVPCCFGNHGRTDPKRKISTGAQNSYEWMMYHDLAELFGGDDRVQFEIADGAHVYSQVFNTRIRWHHGDDVRYWGGVGGLSIPLRKAVDAWDDFQPADLTVIGHYHQFVDYGYAMVNGSLIGYGPYALSVKARYEPPRQASFLVDSKRGKTITAPVFVD